MKPSKHPKRPVFLWQAVLILLPIGILAVLGFLFVRQDKLLVQQEAKERAQGLAEELLRSIRNQLGALSSPPRVPFGLPSDPATNGIQDVFEFEVDLAGNLLWPPAYPSPLIPQPLDISALDTNQGGLWQAARMATYRSEDATVAIKSWLAFLGQSPPPNFTAAGRYELASLRVTLGQAQAAAEDFLAVSQQYPEAVGESGLPLKQLADYRWLQIQLDSRTNAAAVRATNSGPSVETLCTEAVLHPTLITPSLLDWVAKQSTGTSSVHSAAWQRLWQRHEAERVLYRACRSWLIASLPALNREFDHPALVGMHWLSSPTNYFAACFRESATNCWVRCQDDFQVQSLVREILRGLRSIPEYLGFGLRWAGRPLLPTPFSGSEPSVGRRDTPGGARPVPVRAPPVVLASAVDPEVRDQLEATVYLTNPSALFARQRTRSFWFGFVILASAAVSLFGLVSAWRAFRRQERLAELKSNFVSSVSHELRAPIASVRLMAEGLERGRVPTEAKKREYFGFIVKECRRLSALIENVLDFSRIEQGRKQYEFEPTDLTGLARQTLELMQPAAADRQVRVEFRLPPTESEPTRVASGDGQALQQALINLIDNALKHSSPGSTVIVALEDAPPDRAARGASAAPRVHLYVEDQGEGIPAEDHQRIFDQFYRRGSELRRHTQGVGLGLSIVKHIVEAHGGRVLLRSAVGQGSRFTLELPALSACDRSHGQIKRSDPTNLPGSLSKGSPREL